MIVHYLRRFVTSLSRRAPRLADEHWAASLLSRDQWALVARLSNQDRRHLIANARTVNAALAPTTAPELRAAVLAAALLHDVGKVHARLGTFGRSAATIAAVVAGRARVRGWADRPGWRGRVGRYELHGELGAEEIAAAGGPAMAVEWSAIHHHRARFADSEIPPPVLAILDAADH